MSIKLVSAVLEIENITPLVKLFLVALADRSDDQGGQLWPSMGYIAARASCSKRQAQRIMKDMKLAGVVQVISQDKGGRKKTPHYQLNVDRLLQKGDILSPFKRVTPMTLKGDKSAQKRVTPMSPNTPIDSSVAIEGRQNKIDFEKKDEQDVVSEAEAERLFKEDPTKAYCPMKYRGEVLPFNWCSYAESCGIDNERIYVSWRRFKEMSSWPMMFTKWKGWCDREIVMHSRESKEREVQYG